MLIDKIYLAKNGRHIDLSAIIAIDDLADHPDYFLVFVKFHDEGLLFNNLAMHDNLNLDTFVGIGGGIAYANYKDHIKECRIDLLSAWKRYNNQEGQDNER